MKSSDRVLAKKYANAYAQFFDAGQLAAQAMVINQVGLALGGAQIFKDPSFSLAKRKEVLEGVAAQTGQGGAQLKNLLYLLAENKRLNLLAQIALELQNICDAKTNTVRVQISTAAPITAAQKKQVEEKLKTILKADNIVAQYKQDSALIGGIKAVTRDVVLDGTVKHNLDKLKAVLES